MALDINPFSFIGDLYKIGKLQKWYRLIAGCIVASFLGFWGGGGLVGGFVLAATKQPQLSLVSGFLSGCVLMAVCTMMTVKKQKMWEDLGLSIPKQLETILETTDVGNPNGSDTINK